jgi:hypothetical protein
MKYVTWDGDDSNRSARTMLGANDVATIGLDDRVKARPHW